MTSWNLQTLQGAGPVLDHLRVPSFCRSQGQSLSVESVKVNLTFLAGAIYILEWESFKCFCYLLVFKIFVRLFKLFSFCLSPEFLCSFLCNIYFRLVIPYSPTHEFWQVRILSKLWFRAWILLDQCLSTLILQWLLQQCWVSLVMLRWGSRLL